MRSVLVWPRRVALAGEKREFESVKEGTESGLLQGVLGVPAEDSLLLGFADIGEWLF